MKKCCVCGNETKKRKYNNDNEEVCKICRKKIMKNTKKISCNFTVAECRDIVKKSDEEKQIVNTYEMSENPNSRVIIDQFLKYDWFEELLRAFGMIIGIIMILVFISILLSYNNISEFLAGIPLLLAGICTLPYFNDFLLRKYNYKLSFNQIFIIFWCLFFLSGILSSIRFPEKKSNQIETNSNSSQIESSSANTQNTEEQIIDEDTINNENDENNSYINNNVSNKTSSVDKIITDLSLKNDFINACKQIELDITKIENFEKTDDWVGGPRYSFLYKNMPFRLYCNMDSTVNTIKLGTDTDIYKKGFEPYKVSDFIVDSAIALELRGLAEERVKTHLNYPSSSSFAWFDWGYSRNKNLYAVSSSVKASNGFGVQSEIPFKIIYDYANNKKVVYFMINNNVIINNMPSEEERKEIVEKVPGQTTAKKEITLTDGTTGAYGKKVTLDGYDYINYYVPEGTYQVTNNGKWCKVYLASDKYYKNSDGYTENDVIKTLEFSSYKQTATVTVSKGQHLELTINASVTLTPMN